MKSYFVGLWKRVDPLYFKYTRLCYVPDTDEGSSIFRVRLTRYKGVPTILNDCTEINRDDLLLKIHLHNVRMIADLQTIQGDIKRAVYFYNLVKKSMPRLAHFVTEHEQCNHIKAIIGITMLSRGADRLGFEIVPIKNRFYRIFKRCCFLPINLLANTPAKGEPVYLFMSKNNLVNRYQNNISLP